MSSERLTFIDLFAGCGGFSEGFYQEKFKSLIHVDYDAPSCETLKERMKFYNYSDEEISKELSIAADRKGKYGEQGTLELEE